MILILTPLTIEFDALKAALGAVEGVHVATGGHGKVQFALSTQKYITELNPRLVICAGACGALREGPKLLDVVVSTATIEHDYTLRFEKRQLPSFNGDSETLERLRKFNPAGFQIHFGPIASGDEDIIDPVRAKEVHSKTEALAVAWEGAGGARAARFCKTPFIEIRTVTDSADEHAPKNFAHNVGLGMKNIAVIIRAILQTELSRN